MRINIKNITDQVDPKLLSELKAEAKKHNHLLHTREGMGSEFLGWVDLPGKTSADQLQQLQLCADRLAKLAEVVVVIGVGGSYLGTQAVLKALESPFDHLRKERKRPHLIFAGTNLSEDFSHHLMEVLENYSVALIVISKSGRTIEPAIAFRLLRSKIESKNSREEAQKRIVTITDRHHGPLRTMTDIERYENFVIEESIGGRFSVFTPVGLLPLAVAGVDITALIKGAECMEKRTLPSVEFEKNPAEQYAIARTNLYRGGKKIEVFASYEPQLRYIGEWWKQLFGESEGKEGRGLFPTTLSFTADLHSMGQYIQEGERHLFETVIEVRQSIHQIKIPLLKEDLDELNYLADRRLTEINHIVQQGTKLAHIDGEVPNIEIEIERIDEYCIGELLYFFEKACGISGYSLGINPFDQPGVERYKTNIFSLLGKPEYEKEREQLKRRLIEEQLGIK